MAPTTAPPRTRIERAPELGGVDVPHGTGPRPDFPRHLHETFTR